MKLVDDDGVVIGDLSLLEFRPGETAVLTVRGRLSETMVANLEARWAEVFSPNHKLIVMEEILSVKTAPA